MLQLLILTDDFTGALDTGAQFVKCGARTCITTNPKVSLSGTNADVLVIDTETRHKSPEEAFRIIRAVGERASASGVSRIYKKTDSALRGNIGAELDGLMAGSGLDRLAYVPAFPKLRRYTVNGILYIDQKPVSESVFGADPFEPVTESYLPNVIRNQCGRGVRLADISKPVLNPGEITVFDARTDEDLMGIAAVLCRDQQPMLLAGCAGFAEFLARTMTFAHKSTQTFVYGRQTFIMAGSLNPITLHQSRVAKLHHIPSITLAQKYTFQTSEPMEVIADAILHGLREKGVLILETVDSDRPLKYRESIDWRHKDRSMSTSGIISANLGELALTLAEKGFQGTIVVTGGDTLMGVVSRAQSFEITLMAEIEPGVILSRLDLDGHQLTLVSKSGGMGSARVFLNILDYVGRCALRQPQQITV